MFNSTNPITPADLTDRILELIGACGRNKNDRAIVAITLCIGEGVDTRDHIIASLLRADFKGGHAARILDDCCGPFPESYYWWLGNDGRYKLHDGETGLGVLVSTVADDPYLKRARLCSPVRRQRSRH